MDIRVHVHAWMPIRVLLSEWILPWILHGHFNLSFRTLRAQTLLFTYNTRAVILKLSEPIFAHWAVIDPSKISTFMQNSPKNHLF